MRVAGAARRSASQFGCRSSRGQACGLLALLLAFATACVPRIQSTPAPGEANAPWRTMDRPPLVAGIRLGDSLTQVRSVLGTPTEYRQLVGGAHELVYWPPGLAVVTTPDQGAALIGLLSAEAPELAGVRVGDPVPYLVQRWGPPHRRSGVRAAYQAGAWGILVIVDTASTPERIRTITFAWSGKATPSSITPPWPTDAESAASAARRSELPRFASAHGFAPVTTLHGPIEWRNAMIHIPIDAGRAHLQRTW